jgi:hypothetical protein
VSVGSSPPSPQWKLVSMLPSKLIANIVNMYLALPRVAVVGS